MGSGRRNRIQASLDLVGLSGHDRELAGALSAGWRQRLALAIALVHKPELLFLDEPTSGVDPSARRVFWDLIYELAAGGVTVFVTTHFMDEAEYCGRVGMMREGKLLALDTPAELKKSAIPGDVWEVQAGSLQVALQASAGCAGVKRVGLAGDHLRLIYRARPDKKTSSGPAGIGRITGRFDPGRRAHPGRRLPVPGEKLNTDSASLI